MAHLNTTQIEAQAKELVAEVSQQFRMEKEGARWMCADKVATMLHATIRNAVLELIEADRA